MANDNTELEQDMELPVVAQATGEKLDQDIDLLAEVLANIAGTN